MTDEPTGLTVQGKVVKPGALLFQQGATIESAYKVEDGEVELRRGETRIATLKKGDFVGAAAAILGVEQPYTVKGVARPLTYLSEYRGHDVKHAFSANADLAKELYRSLCSELKLVSGAAEEDASDGMANALTEPEIGLRIGKIRSLQVEKAKEVLAAVERRS